jgi:hypothetical protein
MIDEIILEKQSGEDRDVVAIRKFFVLNHCAVFSERKDEIDYLKNVLDKDSHRLFIERNYNHYYIYSNSSGFDSDVYLKEYGDNYSDKAEERAKDLIEKIISIYEGERINLDRFIKEEYTSFKEFKLLVDEGKADEKEDGRYYWVENKEVNKNLGSKEYLERLSKLFGGDIRPKCIYYLTSNYTEGGLELHFILNEDGSVLIDNLEYEEWLNSDYEEVK